MELSRPISLWERIPFIGKFFSWYFSTSRKKRVLFSLLVGLVIYAAHNFTKIINSKKKKLFPPTVIRLQTTHVPTRSNQELKGLRISFSTLGTIFQLDPHQDQISVIEEGIAALLKLLTNNDLYLITKVNSDQEEVTIMKLLDESGVFWAGLNPNKVLFCSTEEGRGHMARQLSVHMHIDESPQVLNFLKPFVPSLVQITPVNEITYVKETNVTKASSLTQYITNSTKN
eukprot:TRINITY_DN5654_c0_g1_i1.p1 TRINITY_DN5654_c0_g1~~TRINITY_DN5654_c0_g1_i1.p1  ORF type:complete len:229 (+),score=38.56 TRINITY_DN5654_c0_g1_i1:95-781(+)